MAKKLNQDAMADLVSGLTNSSNQEGSSSCSSEQFPVPHRGSKTNRKETEIISTVVEKELIGKARSIAGIEGLNIKDIINKGLSMFISRYEEKKGYVRIHRPRKKGDIDHLLDF